MLVGVGLTLPSMKTFKKVQEHKRHQKGILTGKNSNSWDPRLPAFGYLEKCRSCLSKCTDTLGKGRSCRKKTSRPGGRQRGGRSAAACLIGNLGQTCPATFNGTSDMRVLCVRFLHMAQFSESLLRLLNVERNQGSSANCLARQDDEPDTILSSVEDKKRTFVGR